MWKLMTIVALVTIVEGTQIRYPENNSCIMLDVELNNTLTRNKNESVPTFSLEHAEVISGSCTGMVKHTVTLGWAVDGATIQLSFLNNSESVSLMMAFAFVPFKVWKSGSNVSVTMYGNYESLGHTDKSFKCGASKTVTFNETKDASGAVYDSEWNFLTIHAQAFNVEGGNFSDAEHCAGDLTTANPTTHESNVTTETPHTTEGNKTTVHTTITTQPTTENGTTETTNGTTKHTTKTPVITTVTPPPPALHPKNTFTFNDTEVGGQCVRMTGQFLFKIKYDVMKGGTKTVDVGIPAQFNVSGHCNYTGMGLNMMEVAFRKDWTVQWVFSKSGLKSEMLGADSKFWIKSMTLNFMYDKDLFPGINPNKTGKHDSASTNSTSQFSADQGGSYMCNSDTTVDLGNNVQLETWDFQFFAFENKTGFSDKSVNQCSADSKTNSVVPIAVGAALAGLVVIVLIAYLIGRRRNRKGYESV